MEKPFTVNAINPEVGDFLTSSLEMIYLTSAAQGYEIAVILHVCDFYTTCNLSATTCFLSQNELAHQNTCHECIILVQIHECESLPKPPLPQHNFFSLLFSPQLLHT